MGRGDSSMLSIVMSSKEVLPDKARVSPWRVAPTVAFAGVVARASCRVHRDIESLRGRMPPSGIISEGDVSPSGERQASW